MPGLTIDSIAAASQVRHAVSVIESARHELPVGIFKKWHTYILADPDRLINEWIIPMMG